LYEVLAMAIIVAVLARIARPRFANGDRYRALLIMYFGWRLLVDCLKPYPRFEGLTTLQWACAAALAWYAKDASRMVERIGAERTAAAHG
jgi:hypothetical protein